MNLDEFYFELEISTDNKEAIKYALNDFDDLGIEEDKDILKIYCKDDLSNIDFMLQTFCKNAKSKNIDIKYSSKLHKKTNINWIKTYQENIKPLQIDKFYIHTSWQKPKENLINIKLDPALAFGTGHHYTTYSMIENIIKYAKKDDEILDIGTGSGILSIVANKIGAVVDCCDTDEVAIENTKQNFKNNNATFQNCWVGSISKLEKKYNIILANIISDVIISLSGNIKHSLKKNSLVILSGILVKYENKVLQSFQDFDIIEKLKSKDEQWLTLVLKNQEKSGKQI